MNWLAWLVAFATPALSIYFASDFLELFAVFELICALVSYAYGNMWHIDLNWSVFPVVAAHMLEAAAAPPVNGAGLLHTLLALWSARLTFNYLRREGFGALGEREDWRIATMFRQRLGNLVVVPVMILIQTPMILGLCMPAYAFFQPQRGVAPDLFVDYAFAVAALAALCFAEAGDSQLASFVAVNEARAALGAPPQRVLDTGVWRYSRHPNYAGEAAFWLVLAAWAATTRGGGVGGGGAPAALAIGGAVLLVAVLCGSVVIVERRMTRVAERRAQYAQYQRTTSALIPWFPSSSSSSSAAAKTSSSSKKTAKAKSSPATPTRYNLRSASRSGSPLTPKMAVMEQGEETSGGVLRRRVQSRLQQATTPQSAASSPDWAKWS